MAEKKSIWESLKDVPLFKTTKPVVMEKPEKIEDVIIRLKTERQLMEYNIHHANVEPPKSVFDRVDQINLQLAHCHMHWDNGERLVTGKLKETLDSLEDSSALSNPIPHIEYRK